MIAPDAERKYRRQLYMEELKRGGKISLTPEEERSQKERKKLAERLKEEL